MVEVHNIGHHTARERGVMFVCISVRGLDAFLHILH